RRRGDGRGVLLLRPGRAVAAEGDGRDPGCGGAARRPGGAAGAAAGAAAAVRRRGLVVAALAAQGAAAHHVHPLSRGEPPSTPIPLWGTVGGGSPLEAGERR